MFLCDFEKAIAALIAAFGSDVSMCFKSISISFFGNSFIFTNYGTPDESIVVYRGGRIEKIFDDTWRNPDHKEIIQEGDGKELW